MKSLLGFSSSTVAVAFLNFISLMILTRIFIPEDYGSANLIISYSIITSTVLSMSVDQSIMHYYYHYSLKSILVNSFKFATSSIFVLFLIGTILIQVTSFSFVEMILILGYSASLVVNKIYNTMFRMAKAPQDYFLQSFGVKFVELAIILLLVYSFKDDYIYIVLSFIFSVVLLSSIQIGKIKKLITASNSKHEDIDFRNQFNFVTPLMVSILVTALTQNMDKILLGYIVPLGDLGVYYSAFKIVGIITIVYTISSLVWTPVAIKLAADNDDFDQFTNYSVGFFQFISVVILILFFLSKEFLIIILGTDYSGAITLLIVLIGIPIFMIISEPFSTFITVTRNTKYHFKISLAVLLTNIVLIIVLSNYYGTLGASYALLITYIVLYVMRMIAFNLISRSIFKVNFREIINICIVLIIGLAPFQETPYLALFVLIILLVAMLIKDYRKYMYVASKLLN